MNKEDKFCKDCLYMEKGEYCAASSRPDLITGRIGRKCNIERLDGIGRCGSLGNNFKAKPKNNVKSQK